MRKYVFCLGEVLIDFTSAGESANGNRLFEQNAGGAPANVACALARLGTSSYMCGKVGDDMFGRYLRQILQSEGVNVDNLTSDLYAPTTLAFVSLDSLGERSFAFVRNPGADTCLCTKDIRIQDLREAAVLHYGTLSLTHEPASTALLEAIAIAEKTGVITSLDVNLRPLLWGSQDALYQAIHTVLPRSNIVKLSQEELEFATSNTGNSATIIQMATGLVDDYPSIKLLCVTLGERGSMAFWRSSNGIEHLQATSYPVTAVDTTGAGDAFMAGLLHHVVVNGLNELIAHKQTLKSALMFANACGALAVTKRGAIAAMPYASEVESLLTH